MQEKTRGHPTVQKAFIAPATRLPESSYRYWLPRGDRSCVQGDKAGSVAATPLGPHPGFTSVIALSSFRATASSGRRPGRFLRGTTLNRDMSLDTRVWSVRTCYSSFWNVRPHSCA